MTTFDLEPYLVRCQQRVNERLEFWLSQDAPLSPRLLAATRYATFNGGKRIRPVLAFAAAEAVGGHADQALDVACALEMVHSYSLVHDDLPAMDDDDLRRGKPTCHIAFDEATAILAGDSLQCLAFEVLAGSPFDVDADIRLQMIRIMARASGTEGMAGGQALDLEAEGLPLTLEQLEKIHLHKTGCLIQASVEMGALTHRATTPQQIHALDQYAAAIGLAFQVQDDILDVIGDTKQLGKTQGADLALKKATYPAILGLERATHLANELSEQAISALADFGVTATPLRELARYIVSRSH